MKVALIVSKKSVVVDRVITGTDLNLKQFLEEYTKENNYPKMSILKDDGVQVHAVVCESATEDYSVENSRALIAFWA